MIFYDKNQTVFFSDVCNTSRWGEEYRSSHLQLQLLVLSLMDTTPFFMDITMLSMKYWSLSNLLFYHGFLIGQIGHNIYNTLEEFLNI